MLATIRALNLPEKCVIHSSRYLYILKKNEIEMNLLSNQTYKTYIQKHINLIQSQQVIINIKNARHTIFLAKMTIQQRI